MNSCRGNSFLWYHTDYFIRNLNSKGRISECAYRLKSEKRQLEFGDLYCATTKLSLRTSDRCHWCGNPLSFLTVSSFACVRGCGLPRQCAHWLAMTYWTTQAKTNRACPKDGKITTRAKARIARGGIPTNSNLSSG